MDSLDTRFGQMEDQQQRNLREIRDSTQTVIRDSLVHEVQKQIHVVDNDVSDKVRGMEHNLKRMATTVNVHDGDIRDLKTDVIRNKALIKDNDEQVRLLKSALGLLKSDRDLVDRIDKRSGQNLEEIVKLRNDFENRKGETVTILEQKIEAIEAERDKQMNLDIKLDLQSWIDEMRRSDVSQRDSDMSEINRKIKLLEQLEKDLGYLRSSVDHNAQKIEELKELRPRLDTMSRDLGTFRRDLDAAILRLGDSANNAALRGELEELKRRLTDFQSKIGRDLNDLDNKTDTNIQIRTQSIIQRLQV